MVDACTLARQILSGTLLLGQRTVQDFCRLRRRARRIDMIPSPTNGRRTRNDQAGSYSVHADTKWTMPLADGGSAPFRLVPLLWLRVLTRGHLLRYT
jgi:hypothetical protein